MFPARVCPSTKAAKDRDDLLKKAHSRASLMYEYSKQR